MAGGVRLRGDDAVLSALATGRTVQEAAKAGGMSERTVARRLADPAFCERLNAARAALFDQTLGKLANAATAAVEALVTLLRDEPPTVRLGAARAVLELGTKLRESVELERRIAILEGRTNGVPCESNQES